MTPGGGGCNELKTTPLYCPLGDRMRLSQKKEGRFLNSLTETSYNFRLHLLIFEFNEKETQKTVIKKQNLKVCESIYASMFIGVTLPVFEHYHEGTDSKYETFSITLYLWDFLFPL